MENTVENTSDTPIGSSIAGGTRRLFEPQRPRISERDAQIVEIESLIREGLGFNSESIVDDVRVAIALAQRAVLVGMITDFSPDTQLTLSVAVENFRIDHLASILRGPHRTLPLESTVRIVAKVE